MEAIDEFQLKLKNCLSVIWVGPNVIKTLLTLINEKLKEVSEYPLIKVGTCNLHVVNNAFFKRLKPY